MFSGSESSGHSRSGSRDETVREPTSRHTVAPSSNPMTFFPAVKADFMLNGPLTDEMSSVEPFCIVQP